MTIQQRTRLKVSEFKKVLENLRLWLSGAAREEVGKLVRHINWLEHTLLERDREIRELKQGDMFKTMEELQRDPEQPKPAPEPKMERGERLWNMFCDGSDAVQRYLNFNAFQTREGILAEANAWAKEKGRELINGVTVRETDGEGSRASD